MTLEYAKTKDLIITQRDIQEHRLRKLFPLFEEGAVVFPCMIYDGKIVDGHHRSTLADLFGVSTYLYHLEEDDCFSREFFYEVSALVPIRQLELYVKQAETEVKNRIDIINQAAEECGYRNIRSLRNQYPPLEKYGISEDFL